MGNTLPSASGQALSFRVHLAACPQTQVHIVLDGHESANLPPLAASSGNETLAFKWTSDGQYHWLRCEVRGADGKLLLLANPIYINLPRH